MRHARPDPPDHRRIAVDPGCPLAVIPIAHQAQGLVHSHDLAELVVVRAGQGVHHLDDARWPIAAGEVFVVPPGVAHSYPRRHGLALVNLLFAPLETWLPVGDLLALPGWRPLFAGQRGERPGGRLRLLPGELQEVDARLQRLQQAVHARGPGWRALAAGELLALVAILVRLWPERGDTALDPGLAALLGWLHAHHAEPLTLPELAHRAGCSVRSLQRRFRLQLGCTPLEQLERIRLERAAQLLADPRRSVGDVARAVGFTDPSYFARRWRRRYGRPPRQERAWPEASGQRSATPRRAAAGGSARGFRRSGV